MSQLKGGANEGVETEDKASLGDSRLQHALADAVKGEKVVS